MEFSKTDEQRQAELAAAYSKEEGWDKEQEAFRIREKEQDASICILKIQNQINNIITNTSLLGITNEKLVELSTSLISFNDMINAELKSRE